MFSGTTRRFVLPVLAMGVAVAMISTPVPATAASDPLPANQAQAWLDSYFKDGTFWSLDVGIDYAFSAAESGDDEVVQRIARGVAPQVGVDFVLYNDCDECRIAANPDLPYQQTGISAHNLARALVLALVAGQDPHSFGGWDLVSLFDQVVITSAPAAGRLQDVNHYDVQRVNVSDQAYAARGLTETGSPLATQVMSFLLAQQCTAGYFRGTFTADRNSPAQGCDAAGGKPDIDATSTAILQLEALPHTSAIDDAVASAKAWLLTAQRTHGAFASDASGANAVSTGLAARALDDAIVTRRAALWLREHQARNAAGCTTRLSRDRGAVAFDDADWARGVKQGADPAPGIGVTHVDRWLRATAVSYPVLRVVPGPVGSLRVSWPAGRYLGVGGRPAVRFSGLAPYAAACASGAGRGQAYAGASGSGSVAFTVANVTGRRTVTVTDGDGRHVSHAYTVLGKKKLRMHASKRSVRRGGREQVTLSGLAAYEHVTVRVDGHVVKHGIAGSHGRYQTSVGVGRRIGTHHVHVTGASWYRSAKITFHVQR